MLVKIQAINKTIQKKKIKSIINSFNTSKLVNINL